MSGLSRNASIRGPAAVRGASSRLCDYLHRHGSVEVRSFAAAMGWSARVGWDAVRAALRGRYVLAEGDRVHLTAAGRELAEEVADLLAQERTRRFVTAAVEERRERVRVLEIVPEEEAGWTEQALAAAVDLVPHAEALRLGYDLAELYASQGQRRPLAAHMGAVLRRWPETPLGALRDAITAGHNEGKYRCGHEAPAEVQAAIEAGAHWTSWDSAE